MTDEEDQAELDRIMNMSEEELNAELSPDQHAHVIFMTGLFAQKHLSNHQIAAILRADMENRRALRKGAKPNFTGDPKEAQKAAVFKVFKDWL